MLLAIAACAGPADLPPQVAAPAAPDARYAELGPNPVGVSVRVLLDGDRDDRPVTTVAFYPAAEAGPSTPVADLVPDAAHAATLSTLISAAPVTCVPREVAATAEAAPASISAPLVLLSHCYGCLALSLHGVATRLASHGFAAVVVEHSGGAIWDDLAGRELPLDDAFLQVRAADVEFVREAVVAGASAILPEGLTVDSARFGLVGHSYGGATAALVAGRNAEAAAVAALAVPLANPLFPSIDLEKITIPALLVEAVEDNSIGAAGNAFLRDNFRRLDGPAWHAALADAGHWSPTDVPGLLPAFAPGCGEGERQTNGQSFAYADPEATRAHVASLVSALMAFALRDEAGAGAWLDEGPGGPAVTMRSTASD